MYSWGHGQYGALGFGTREDISEPRQLKIMKGDTEYPIIGICSGKFHSMCLTQKKRAFSWGTGLHGRLGHGDEEDVLVPKEILDFSKVKPIFIAAGESHSAAISEKLRLYTWGNGTYGRLGHGMDVNEKRPKIVEDLDQYEIIHVSCGAFHTLATNTSGSVYAFGQGKYGKLGINKKQREGIVSIPEKINFYKIVQDQLDKSDQIVQEKSEAIQVAAGYNHSLCLAQSGKVYSWGYSGKGILGRNEKLEQHLPLEIGSAQGEFQAKIPSKDECGQLNTAALTNGGEVYVLGSNSYGQLGREMDQAQFKKHRSLDLTQNDGDYVMDQAEFMSLIKFPGESTVRINFIACGGEHLFAISRMNELFGWGRNQEGQLGLGFISEYQAEPTLIRDIAHKNISFICCGDNYSAALSSFGEVFVTGNLEYGKLGLGSALKKGFILNFTLIQNIPQMKYLACGPNHMLAISEYNPENPDYQDGSLYAWGKNSRGQLGIGSKDDQNVPRKIMSVNEKFRKVACGIDFSMVLSNSGQLYMMGNYKYLQEIKIQKDIEIPTLIPNLEYTVIKDIACSYKYCSVLNDKGEIFIWGSFLKDKIKLKKKKKKDANIQSQESLLMQKFPMRKFDFLMEQLSTGPNHSAAVSVKKSLYCWGFAEGGRLGIEKKEFKNAKHEPINVAMINDLMLKNKQNLKEGRGGQQESMANQEEGLSKSNLLKEESKTIIEDKKDKIALPYDQEKKQDASVEEEKVPQEQFIFFYLFSDHILDEEEEEEMMADLEYIEKQIKDEEDHQDKLPLISLTRQSTLLEAHILLQRILKKERFDQVEEFQILKFDDELLRDIDKLIVQIKSYKKLDVERQEMLTQIQSSFLTRIGETPFMITHKQMPKFEKESIFQNYKKQIKELITLIHVHPCYMVGIYKANVMDMGEYQNLFKEIYSYQNERVNYLLMAVCEGVIKWELMPIQFLEDVNFMTTESAVGKIFYQILKSQETNIDTVCSIACHSNILPLRAKQLYNFIDEIIKDIMENEVLSTTNSYFIPKKSVVEEMNYKKKIMGYNDQNFKLDCLRFSAEISYLAEAISKNLRKLSSKGAADDLINTKVLSLVFGMLEKVWKDYEIYLFPYIKTVKGLSIIEDVINKTHLNNLNNIFAVMNCFFRNEVVFPEFQLSDQWCKDFNLKLTHLQQSTKGIILQRIIDKNVMKQVGFKNFENLLLHTLDVIIIAQPQQSEGHTISIRKKTLGRLLQVLKEKPVDISQIKPWPDDPLYLILEEIKDDGRHLLKNNKDEKINIKLNTRLFLQEDNLVTSRCPICSCVLISKYAPNHSTSIIERYNPDDSQSLLVQYSKILKQIDDIQQTEDIIMFIEVSPFCQLVQKTYVKFKKDQKYDQANMMLKFLNQVDLDVQNVQNKIMNVGAQEQNESKIKEQIYIDIQKQAEIKINERRARRNDMLFIQRRIQNVLIKKVQAKAKYIEEKELILYKLAHFNIQYGLANHELKHLADAYTLKHMRKIIDFTTGAKMSKNLFKNLRNEQKIGLRAIVKKSAKHLIKNQTITSLKLNQLKPLINKCEFFFIENEDLSINVKLVFRETKWSLCGPPKILSEAVLLNFQISMKELLEMRKNVKSSADKRLVLANSIEFDHIKLLKIFNEMERSKSAYSLNSGTTPLIMQQQKSPDEEEGTRI